MFFQKDKIRTRFAPSPTGFMHVGSLRTALYSYLYAKQQRGKFVLRVEDTDRERYVEGSLENIEKILNLFGLNYDEGPNKSGKYGPYVQSERLGIYKRYTDQLLNSGHAYHCFCSSEDLEKMRAKQITKKMPPKYDRRCLDLSIEEVKKRLNNKEKFVIRLKIPAGQTEFTDLVRGQIVVHNDLLDDQVLLKSDGYPTYHLAVVVDDHLMKISHIIRGEEWIPSTPKHIIIYKALNWNIPKFAHIPLLLNSDKSKLSKRQGDVTVEDYLQKGYLPEALLNFISLLGWNPGDNREIFSLTELIKEFNLKKVQRGGAVFDIEKLKWMNCQYIKRIDSKILYKQARSYLELTPKFDSRKYDVNKIVDLFKDRLNNFGELKSQAEFIYELPNYDGGILVPKKSNQENTGRVLSEAVRLINNFSKTWQADILRNYFDEGREELGFNRAEMFWPLRVAVSGQQNSPDLFDIMEIIGKPESLYRLDIAIDKIKKL